LSFKFGHVRRGRVKAMCVKRGGEGWGERILEASG